MAKQLDWLPTCKRFVAFLDIMGFKDRMLRYPHEKVLETLTSFRMAVRPLGIAENLAASAVRPVFFSDSILLVSGDDSLESALRITLSAEWFVQEALDIQIPIKGAIAFGMQTANFEDSLHFGAPLIDAYELQNQVKLYGVVLHHTTEKRLADLRVLDPDKYRSISPNVVEYPVPLKEGKVNHYILRFFTHSVASGSLESSLLKLYGTVSGSPRSYVDNTLDLARWLDKKGRKT